MTNWMNLLATFSWIDLDAIVLPAEALLIPNEDTNDGEDL